MELNYKNPKHTKTKSFEKYKDQIQKNSCIED